ncbi:MAG TPA: dihydrodipicolinate reductase C-terminal domain-containing protein [Chthoniobacterales bacterium]|jgi:4-hydroxy-tetrahydrodipicolinate reductase
MRILLIGAGGRMGHAVLAAAAQDSSLTIAAKVERGGALALALERCEVAIDFTVAEATEGVVQSCAERRKPLVLGTTGQSAGQKEAIAAASREIPIVFAANFSIGVNVLFALARRAAELLGKEFDRDIIEMHHRTKKDAPSGTAKRLAAILGEDLVEPVSVRAGDIVGEHAVIFSGTGERLELIHRAGSRATFAQGALRAARWVVRQSAGLYSMEDVLGL